MSYILEALAKSEEERKQRSVPDLQTRHGVYPGMARERRRSAQPVRRIRPLILLAILFLLSAYLFRDLLPVALEIKITRPNTSGEKTAQSQILPDPASLTDLANPTTEISQNHSEQSLAEMSSQPAESIGSTENKEETGQELIGPSPEPTIAKAVGDDALIAREMRLQPAPLVLTGEDSLQPMAVATLLPFIDDLPPALRESLPELKFAGHTYSSEPAERLILVNSSIRREGETISPGLRLVEITWDGVVLDYRGTRFQMFTTGN